MSIYDIISIIGAVILGYFGIKIINDSTKSYNKKPKCPK